jgi:flagellar biosynthetic protein FliR
MTLLEAQLSAWLAEFFWPLMRIGAIFTAAPIFSARQLPVRYRVVLVLLITYIAAPLLPPMPQVQAISPEAAVILVQQLAIGLMMGFGLQLVMGTVVFGGQLMAFKMGMGFASMVDPVNGMQTPVVSQIFLLTATLIFLVTNSHLLLITLVVDSFQSLPVGAPLESLHFWNLAAWGGRVFAIGLLMSLPVMGSLMLVNFAMAILARAAPQFNLFAVGLPVTIIMGFVIIWVSLPSVLQLFVEMLEEAFSLIGSFVGLVR